MPNDNKTVPIPWAFQPPTVFTTNSTAADFQWWVEQSRLFSMRWSVTAPSEFVNPQADDHAWLNPA